MDTILALYDRPRWYFLESMCHQRSRVISRELPETRRVDKVTTV